MPRENKNQYPILGFLSRMELSGYDIQKLSKRSGNYYWSDCNPQVYNTLKKLEKDGLVSSRIDADSGARQRRVYTITEEGMTFYKAWLERPVENVLYRDELLLKVANGQHLSHDQLLQHLNDEKLRVSTQLGEIKEIRAHIEKDHEGREDKDYLLSIYDYLVQSLNLRLDWLEQSVKKLGGI